MHEEAPRGTSEFRTNGCANELEHVFPWRSGERDVHGSHGLLKCVCGWGRVTESVF